MGTEHIRRDAWTFRKVASVMKTWKLLSPESFSTLDRDVVSEGVDKAGAVSDVRLDW